MDIFTYLKKDHLKTNELFEKILSPRSPKSIGKELVWKIEEMKQIIKFPETVQ